MVFLVDIPLSKDVDAETFQRVKADILERLSTRFIGHKILGIAAMRDDTPGLTANEKEEV